MPLTELTFDNRFVDQLPADPEVGNFRRQVTNACYSRVNPARATEPKLVCYSEEIAHDLGLSAEDCNTDIFLRVFAGNELVHGMDPFAMCYGGHQFGHWAGQLGDGRAITLGEIALNPKHRMSLQLKGAGETPYSRTADGLAVLRSSLREYVCSEAMHFLGVPTTRALSLILTGDEVIRDMLYDGHPAAEQGAVVCRVAPSFVRFGNFEICAARQDTSLLKQLTDFTIAGDFPNLSHLEGKERYIEWYREVVRLTAVLIVEWMRVGFVHGVMNTDNMSILGLTIDYGPYGWLEDFDPNWTPNTTDAGTRRYRYGQQPAIAHWNLLQLANAVLPLVGETQLFEEALAEYNERYSSLWLETIKRKLGFHATTKVEYEFLAEMEQVLLATETDLTLFYRYLANIDINQTIEGTKGVEQIQGAYYKPKELQGDIRDQVNKWLKHYAETLRRDNRDSKDRVAQMNSNNPFYVPRNYLAQLAIDRVELGDHEFLKDWMTVLRHPYTEQPGKEAYAAKRPEWARTRVGCSMLSCSS